MSAAKDELDAKDALDNEEASLRVVFMGSPEFAVPIFNAVADAHDVRLVVTQPDRPAGRGRRLRPPPVKVSAMARDIPVTVRRSRVHVRAGPSHRFSVEAAG